MGIMVDGVWHPDGTFPTTQGHFVRAQSGFRNWVTRSGEPGPSGDGGFKAESILINCHYPVTQDSFMLQWGVIVEKPRGLDDATTEKIASGFTAGVSKGFLQDVEIWKHKTRIDNPLLVEEDGAVYQMRRWYQQFYVDIADVTSEMTDRFELEVDTTAANEKWHVEVEENLKRQADEPEGRPSKVSG